MDLELIRNIDSVRVFKQQSFAGILSRTEHGARFTYDDSFRHTALARKDYGLSFSLSPSQDSYEVSGSNLHPFFAGLLPEGLRLKALRQALKTSEDDLFSMLVALGTNCVGDVYVKMDSQEEAADTPLAPSLESISFIEIFNSSIHAGDFRAREADPGIPGMIPKLSASMISFPIQISKKNKQYLLKLASDEHPRIIENEHFFMQMAKACGFDAAKTTIVHDRDGIPGLLVERFDRVHEKGANVFLRLHQEDACQILNRYPHDKYRLSMRDIAEGLNRSSSSPLIDIRKLIELYVFSYLIGNGDLHAKNISLLQEPHSGRIRFSPVYDLLTTLPYGDRRMALRLGAKDDNFRRHEFVEFGKLFCIPEKAVLSSIDRLMQKVTPWMNRIDGIGFNDKQSRDLKNTFEERAKKLEAD